jgi:GxxExxY protein
MICGGPCIAPLVRVVLAGTPRVNEITNQVIGGALRVHRVFGPGLFEAPYCLALAIELTKRGLPFQVEVPLEASYDGRDLGVGYKLDFVVADLVVVEIKALEQLLPIHRQQLTTYLKLSGYPAGLLINFNVPLLKNGLMRVLNDKPHTV